MSTTVRVKAGRSYATVTGPSAAELEQAVRRAMGPALEVAEAAVRRVEAEHVDKDWPVKTGASRDAWHVVLTIDAQKYRVEAALHNPLDYTRNIKSLKRGRRRDATRLRSPIVTEVRRPIATARLAVTDDLKRALARSLQEAFDG